MRCLVIGLGKSGFASALALKEQNNEVTVLEESPSPENFERAAELKKRGIKVSEKAGPEFDLIVPSPAVPYHHPLLNKTKASIISEIELGYRLNKPKTLIAVTGTNGKTTTVCMIRDIFARSGKKFKVAGNIGNPYVGLRNEDLTETVLILELSSFQLHFINEFKADVAVLLNVTEDHIDWHNDFLNYLEDKKKIFLNQKSGDKAIINVDDEAAAALSSDLNGLQTLSTMKEADFCLKEGSLYHNNRLIMPGSDLSLAGDHNIINALAACAASHCAGVSLKVCAQALKDFKGLPHRLENAGTIKGRTFINDSKSTNPDSTVKALNSMDKPAIVLIGGRNKDNDFSGIPADNIKEAVFFGEAASEIQAQLPYVKGSSASSLQEAVEKAYKLSAEGDVILLSPGCASFDEFNSYKHRGESFKKVVAEISR